MNILKEVLAGEVFPAVGCTEPVACAYASAVAAGHLGAPVEQLDVAVDTGTYKNGAAVIVPRTGGGKGNRLAAAMGAVLACGQARLELLGAATPDVLARARKLIDGGKVSYRALPDATALRIEAAVSGGGHTARCVLSRGHTRIELIEHDGEVVQRCAPTGESAGEGGYRDVLKVMSLSDILAAAVDLDDDDREFLRAGIAMNLAMVDRGR